MNFKTNRRINPVGGLFLIAGALFFCAFTMPQQAKVWNAPASAKSMKNKVKANADNLADAKALYAKHCRSCHGNHGNGDGPKAANLDVSCKDFSKASFQGQADGEIFWKMTEGRDPMPTFKSKLSDDERWEMVNYLRTFKK